MAIWLKADAGGADIIYPLAPVPDGLKANSPYSEADFLKVVVPLAKTRTATSPSHPVP